MMRKFKLKSYHPIVFYLAIMLTTLSIIGSIIISALLPTPVAQATDMREKPKSPAPVMHPEPSVHQPSQSTNMTPTQVDFKSDTFRSVVKPKLTECFNCGVVVSIRTVATAPSMDVLPEGFEDANKDKLAESLLSDYLNAHQKNARLLTTDTTFADTSLSDVTIAGKQVIAHVIDVRMHNGRYLKVRQNGLPQHSIGDRVRIINSNTIDA